MKDQDLRAETRARKRLRKKGQLGPKTWRDLQGEPCYGPPLPKLIFRMPDVRFSDFVAPYNTIFLRYYHGPDGQVFQWERVSSREVRSTREILLRSRKR